MAGHAIETIVDRLDHLGIGIVEDKSHARLVLAEIGVLHQVIDGFALQTV